MAIDGEIKTAKELGLPGFHKRIWTICPECKNGRWVLVSTTKRPNFTGRCHRCNALYRGGYRIKSGGRWINSQGYVLILLQPSDFFYSMAGIDGYILEHRLVMAKHLGRCLQSWELVHHKGDKFPKGSKENRADNRLENLQLVTDDRHKQITILESKIKRLQDKNHELKQEIKALKSKHLLKEIPQ